MQEAFALVLGQVLAFSINSDQFVRHLITFTQMRPGVKGRVLVADRYYNVVLCGTSKAEKAHGQKHQHQVRRPF